MRLFLLTLLSITLFVSPVLAVNYGSYLETPGSPAICVSDGDIFIAWARPDYSLKMGYFTLKTSGGKQIVEEEVESLSDRTDSPFAIVSDGKKLALVWSDAQNDEIYLAYYKLKQGNKFEYVDTKKTGEKCIGGLSAYLYGDDLVIGFTDEKDETAKIITYSLAKKRPKRGIQRKLSECPTTVRSAIAIAQDILLVEWEDEDGDMHLTTYTISDSSKGLSIEYLKDYPLNIATNEFVSVTGKGNEFFVGYVDRNDKYMHVKSYTIEPDNTLTSGSSVRISEKPASSFSLAVDDKGDIYTVYKDKDGGINLYKK